MFHLCLCLDFHMSRKGIVENHKYKQLLVFLWELCSRALHQCSSSVPHPQESQCLMTEPKKDPVLIAIKALYVCFWRDRWDCPRDLQDWDPPILWSRTPFFPCRDSSVSEVQIDMFFRWAGVPRTWTILMSSKMAASFGQNCTFSRTYKWIRCYHLAWTEAFAIAHIKLLFMIEFHHRTV